MTPSLHFCTQLLILRKISICRQSAPVGTRTIGAFGGVCQAIEDKPWQIQQAVDAVRIYRYQDRRARDNDGGKAARGPKDGDAMFLEVETRTLSRSPYGISI